MPPGKARRASPGCGEGAEGARWKGPLLEGFLLILTFCSGVPCQLHQDAVSLPAADAVASILPGKQPFPRGTGMSPEKLRYRGHTDFVAPSWVLLLLPISILTFSSLPPPCTPIPTSFAPTPQRGSCLHRRAPQPRFCWCFSPLRAASQGCHPVSDLQVPGGHRGQAEDGDR